MVIFASDKLLISVAAPEERVLIWVWIEEVTPERYPISVAVAPATFDELIEISAVWAVVIPT